MKEYKSGFIWITRETVGLDLSNTHDFNKLGGGGLSDGSMHLDQSLQRAAKAGRNEVPVHCNLHTGLRNSIVINSY